MFLRGSQGRTGLAVIMTAFTIRLAIVFMAGSPDEPSTWSAWTLDPDSHNYLALADDLSDGVQDSTSTRTPGYPAFLLAARELGGTTLPAVLLQQILDLVTAAMAGALSLRSGCRRWWAASLLYLMIPAAAATSTRILPDTLLAAISIASGLIWLSAAGTGRPRVLVGLHGVIGLLLSAGALVKPVLLFAPGVYVILIPFTRIRSVPARVVAVLVLLASAAAGPAAWRAHNLASFGMDAVSAQDGYEQAGRIWVLTGRATQYEFLTSVKDSVETLSSRNGVIDYGLRSSIYADMALEEFRRHPAEVIVPHLTSWPRFFSTGTGNTLRYLGFAQDGPAALPVKAASALVILTMPAGLAAGLLIGRIRRRLRPLLLLAGAWMILMSLVHGPLAGPRYGLTFFPVLCAAGTASLCLLRRRRTMAAGTNGTSAQ